MMNYIETKKILQRDLDCMIENKALSDSIEAMKTAIIAVGAIGQIQWERDLAIEQLKELGYGLGEKVNMSENILTAQEAYEMTKQNIDKCLTKQLSEVTEKIKKAIEDGNFAISEDGVLQYETKLRLEELGYKVETGSQYNEPYYIIKWK